MYQTKKGLYVTPWSSSAIIRAITANNLPHARLRDRPAERKEEFASKIYIFDMADRLHTAFSYRLFPRMKTPSTDRRTCERYDVVGALWGVLELPEVAHIVNVSSSGLLIEAAFSPVLNSVHTVRMLVDGDFVRVDTVVRHCRSGPAGKNYIGLEFLKVPTTVLASIEQLGADKQIEVIDAGASRS